MKKIGFQIQDDLYKCIKIQIIKSDMTIKDYVTNLIRKDLETKKDIHL